MGTDHLNEIWKPGGPRLDSERLDDLSSLLKEARLGQSGRKIDCSKRFMRIFMDWLSG